MKYMAIQDPECGWIEFHGQYIDNEVVVEILNNQEKEIEELKEALNEAMGWNWLDEDFPLEIHQQLTDLIKGEKKS